VGVAEIEVARVGGRSVVTRARATSPLRLLTPRNHGDGAWVYLSSFGGGLVDGDRLRVSIRTLGDATALLTTQAQTKAYRARTRGSSQDLAADVAPGGLLVIAPDPVACFRGAIYAQSSRADIAPGGSLVHVEALARGRGWGLARYASELVVVRDGARVLRDATHLDPAHGDVAARMGRFAVIGTVVAIGPRAARVRDAMRAVAARPLQRGAPLLAAASRPSGIDDAIVVRLATVTTDVYVATVRAMLAPAIDELGDDPFARKW